MSAEQILDRNCRKPGLFGDLIKKWILNCMTTNLYSEYILKHLFWKINWFGVLRRIDIISSIYRLYAKTNETL
mgnify:CR=1 FL=1